jgi:undecaprenyl-diphosphatase
MRERNAQRQRADWPFGQPCALRRDSSAIPHLRCALSESFQALNGNGLSRAGCAGARLSYSVAVMRRRSFHAALAALLLLGAVLCVLQIFEAAASGVAPAASTSSDELSLVDAVVLGVVEGVTEYLPVSSTGHLLLASEALGLTTTEEGKKAADAYVIVIQFGAILAVLVLYARRIWSILRGIIGRDPGGRRVAVALVASVIPAVIIGVLGEQLLKDYLFRLWPITAAWLAGGVVILIVARHDRRTGRTSTDGATLEELSVGRALVIGLLQCVAMWPGVSRSLATILGGRLMGLSTQAAVEYSFLLGLVTLTGATLVETAKEGQVIVDTLGVTAPIVGVVVAFVAAALSIKWMVGYLNRHSLAVFGYYRIGLAAVVAALLVTHVL